MFVYNVHIEQQPALADPTLQVTVHSRGTSTSKPLHITDTTQPDSSLYQATTVFHDATPGQGAGIVSPLEGTYDIGSTSDVPLAQFLKRPVKIWEDTWSTGSTFNATLNPWLLFVVHSSIEDKIRNYRFLRGHLKLRIVVTGNPFLYGRAIVAYEPWFHRSVWSPNGYGNTNQRVYKTVISQMPHVYIDTSTSQGGEMVLPFFSPFNWLDVTSVTMAEEMGQIFINNFTELRHANAPAGAATVQIYAWMDDAELCVPTVADIGTEVYQGNDEWKEGLISKPASAVARAAGMLSKIPIFKPYALPTEMAATAIGKAASAFGFSRPAIIDNTCVVRDKIAGDLASTNTHEVVGRLALDTKSQLTLDPRTVGLDGTDEMALSHIVQREALMHSFNWGEADPADATLFEFRVGPTYHSLDTTTTQNRNGIPPCTAVASMFHAWRGTMVYRFSIVASAMHRGKLLVTYEPTDSGDTYSTDTNYSRIIDIGETRDFEIPVHWHAPTPWQTVRDTTLGDAADRHLYDGTPTSIVEANLYFNGRIRVNVLTSLTSPDPALANPVTILWYVRGGEDLEFANPRSTALPFTYKSTDGSLIPQGCDLEEEFQGEEEDISPEPPLSAPVNAETQIVSVGNNHHLVDDPLTHVFYGETVSSVRSFLKRYRARGSPEVDSFLITAITGAPARSNARNNVLSTHMPIDEFIFAWFLGWRGSLRQKFVGADTAVMLGADRGYVSVASERTGHAGLHANHGVCEVELPFYSTRRFAFTRTSPSWTNDTNLDPYDPNNQCLYMSRFQTINTTAWRYTAVGDDFSLFFFHCIPPVFAL